MGKGSFEVKKRLQKWIAAYYPQCKLQVIFNSNNRLRNLFNFKDKIPLNVRSHLIYRYTCDSCNTIYIGKTRRHYAVRVFEHLGLSLRTHKRYTFNPKNSNNTAVLSHINTGPCINTGNKENFRIIGSAKNDHLLCIKETLLIHKLKPKINTSDGSTPIYLFE